MIIKEILKKLGIRSVGELLHGVRGRAKHWFSCFISTTVTAATIIK